MIERYYYIASPVSPSWQNLLKPDHCTPYIHNVYYYIPESSFADRQRTTASTGYWISPYALLRGLWLPRWRWVYAQLHSLLTAIADLRSSWRVSRLLPTLLRRYRFKYSLSSITLQPHIPPTMYRSMALHEGWELPDMPAKVLWPASGILGRGNSTIAGGGAGERPITRLSRCSTSIGWKKFWTYEDQSSSMHSFLGSL